MARLSAALVLVLFAITVSAKRVKNYPSTGSPVVAISNSSSTALPARRLHPNKHKYLTDAEIAMHPKLRVRAVNRAVAPTAFDARTQWPNCISIKTIRDQGECGTCWAVSSASVMSDRICIASGQKTNIYISGNQAASCTFPTQTGTQNCQDGGNPAYVYQLAAKTGFVTGGEYNSGIGCVPYQPTDYTAPPLTCATQCTNSQYTTPFAQDGHIVSSYYINYQPQNAVMTASQIATAVTAMQTDIMANGPITATMTVYQDFEDWESSQGAYKGPQTGLQSLGGHAIKLIGWNVDQNNVPYWIVSNSWGTSAGAQGIFWIAMGSNVVGIEAAFSAPIVTATTPANSSPTSAPAATTAATTKATTAAPAPASSTSGATFCSTPIDQAVSTNSQSATAPIYLFQGNYVQQVSVSGTKLVAVGSKALISSVFTGAPSSPITSNMVQGGLFYLINPSYQAGGCSAATSGSTKFVCQGATVSGGPAGGLLEANFYTGSTLNVWTYYPMYNTYLFNTQGQGVSIGAAVTSYFSTVTAVLNLNGASMMVFGTDSNGNSIAGVLPYPVNNAALPWTVAPGPVKNLLTCSA